MHQSSIHISLTASVTVTAANAFSGDSMLRVHFLA